MPESNGSNWKHKAPELAALVVVVGLFLAFQLKRDAAFVAVLEDASRDCHLIQARSVDALEANTEMLGQVKEALRRK